MNNTDSGSYHFKPMHNPLQENIQKFPTIMEEFKVAYDLLERCMNSTEFIDSIHKASEIIIECFRNGGKLIVCGNGGSMSDAMHFASELTGRFKNDRQPFPAIAISDPAHLSCVGNDFGFKYVFSRPVQALCKPEDVLFLITTSGNSQNILEAYQTPPKAGLPTAIILTGNNGGKIIKHLDSRDLMINVPYSGYADRIQEIHIKIIHILCTLIEKALCKH